MDELKKEVEEWTSCSPTMRAAVIMTVETLKNCNEQFLTTDEDRRQHDLVCALTDADILQITQLFEEVLKEMKEKGGTPNDDEFQNMLIQFIIYFISHPPSRPL